MNVYIESLLNGLMVYWDEEKDAARYYVHLLIGDRHKVDKMINGRMTATYSDETFQEIAFVETERNIKYYSFTNLGKIDEYEPQKDPRGFRVSGARTGKNYYVYVEAEDKNGAIIAQSPKIMGVVYVMSNGFFSRIK